MKISYFIFLGFFLILLMFSLTTYLTYRFSKQVDENSEWFARSTTIVRHSNRFQRNTLNMMSGLRGYLLTGEDYFIQAYDSAFHENEAILKELQSFVSDNPTQQKSLNEILELNNQWVNEFAVPLLRARQTASFSDSSRQAFNALYREHFSNDREKKLNTRLQARFRDFSNYEYNLRDVRKAALDTSIDETLNVSLYLTCFSILAGLIIAGFLAYRISSRIVTMARMADSIALGNYNVFIQDRAKDELGKLAESLNHMASMLSENISLLKRKNEELDQFAHIVSHDMKAPLRGIDNVITWIEEDHYHELSPKVKEYISLIKGRIIRAENLIRGILSYSVVGKDEVEKEEVDVKQLLREIQETLPLKSGIKVKIQTGMPVFTTEKLPLMQIFSNLLSNAIKYHDKQKGEIKVYYKNHPKHYEFFIEDNGPGIAKHYHDKIFMIFQTLHERDSFESTGVGLAIVKKILDERKQEIKVISEPGKGAIFAFTWPKL